MVLKQSIDAEKREVLASALDGVGIYHPLHVLENPLFRVVRVQPDWEHLTPSTAEVFAKEVRAALRRAGCLEFYCYWRFEGEMVMAWGHTTGRMM